MEMQVGSVVVKLDAADYRRAIQYKWRIAWIDGKPYVCTTHNQKVLYLHRIIMRARRGFVVRHINGDNLDNRKKNLRVEKRLQLAAKKHLSDYRGVYWDKATRKWYAKFKFLGETLYYGYFDDEKEAAQTYNRAASEKLGTQAQLNVL